MAVVQAPVSGAHPAFEGAQRPQVKPTVSITTLQALQGVRFGATSTAGPESWQDGATVVDNKTRVKVWAPSSNQVDLLVIRPPKTQTSGSVEPFDQRIEKSIQMTPDQKGSFSLETQDLPPGTRYMFRLHKKDGSVSKPLPDPYSRFQPEDIHGPSEVVQLKPSAPFAPTAPFDKRKAIVLHLHVGTFSPEGTFEGLAKKLDYIKEMGYTHVKIMPVDEFAGKWNWGYDGVLKHAVENAYGKPNDFLRFSEECHKRGLGLIVDVQYNHIGPEGNYFREFDPNYIDPTPPTREWGDLFNWENPKALNYVLKSLEMLVQDYQVDGFRFDMSSRIPDHILRTINNRLQQINPNVMLIAEDDRTSNHVTLPTSAGGLGFWAKHNFAWHHRVKGAVTGHSHMDAPKDPQSLSWILEEEHPGPGNPANSSHDYSHFFESHDEIGNHDGQRTSTKIARNRFIVGSLLKYAVPGVVWNFQGEESYAQTPFYYFVNHSDPQVIAGTRHGRRFSPQPDCMRPENFTESKIQWDKLDKGMIQMNKVLNQLRHKVPALWQGDQAQMQIDRQYLNSGILVIRRAGKENPESKVTIVVNLSDYHYKNNYGVRFSEITPHSDGGTVNRRWFAGQNPKDWEGDWQEIFNSEAIDFGGNGWTNSGKTYSNKGDINLPAWSVAIFEKKTP
jgi:maltooligosyltrehalose trehalohydrolase